MTDFDVADASKEPVLSRSLLTTTAIYYAALMLAVIVLPDLVETSDPSLGTHMGSDAVAFVYTAASMAAYLAPVIALPILSVRVSEVRWLLVAAVVATVVISTAWFYGTGWANCVPGQLFPNEALYLWGTLGSVGLIAAGTSAIREGVSPRFLFGTLGVALVVAATWAFMYTVQGEHCSGPSSQITRGSTALMFPIWMVITYPMALLGTWLVRLFDS